MSTADTSLVLVTISGSQPLISQQWMEANRCVRVGDNAFLLRDDITLEQARKKFIGLVARDAGINAFPVGLPFLYQNNIVLQEGVNRIFGH
jgi:hypothetical protein